MSAPSSTTFVDTRSFRAVAWTSGIGGSEATLRLTGRIVRVEVGRRGYYRWADLLPLMSPPARRRHVALGRGVAR